MHANIVSCNLVLSLVLCLLRVFCAGPLFACPALPSPLFCSSTVSAAVLLVCSSAIRVDCRGFTWCGVGFVGNVIFLFGYKPSLSLFGSGHTFGSSANLSLEATLGACANAPLEGNLGASAVSNVFLADGVDGFRVAS